MGYSLLKTFYIDPMGKPRILRGQTDITAVRWRNYKEALKILRGAFAVPTESILILFVIPMPESWSDKKRKAMRFKRHQQKPDIDNLHKGFLDALYDCDQIFWDAHIVKIWGESGSIQVFKTPPITIPIMFPGGQLVLVEA